MIEMPKPMAMATNRNEFFNKSSSSPFPMGVIVKRIECDFGGIFERKQIV